MLERNHSHEVTVIGCGLMGAALARNFAARGFRTTAWNRTPEKSEALAAHGVDPVAIASDAVAAAPLVVLCTSTYATTRDALAGVTDLTGTTLVNLGTAAPSEAEEFEAWAAERGGAYLDGAILCHPEHIGTAEGMVLFSGSPDAWKAHEATLTTTGAFSVLVAEKVRGASVLDAAVTGAFYTSALTAYIEGATYALLEGVDPEMFGAVSGIMTQVLADTSKHVVEAITTGNYETDSAYLSVYAEGCRAGVQLMQSEGYKASMLATAVENMNEAEEAGLGQLSLFALSTLARPRATA
ncbi:NAD(P)-dependent oxidoreductase [Tsukamurella sputi]|uniref:NAD(P)-dependent oxidoreductase n=1 Tax=Tsukamurella sputi TaxID=2591848 RepID=A0A5C5RUJ4_9ACTN|nr:NAD(P)-binding domain-containing protein [Tsukamurella sputi]TWS26312.1 NAD(P)-dependent oxidoreductase [Tsukamurella sputi]